MARNSARNVLLDGTREREAARILLGALDFLRGERRERDFQVLRLSLLPVRQDGATVGPMSREKIAEVFGVSENEVLNDLRSAAEKMAVFLDRFDEIFPLPAEESPTVVSRRTAREVPSPIFF